MKLGTNTIASLKIGSTDISEVRIGSTLVWQNVDADAAAFIAAAGITDATQKSAINTLVVDLKAYSIWTKAYSIYPFVGGTATTHKFNLKNPLDTDAAFRLVFAGGLTHSSNGVDPNGTTGTADTFINPSTHLSLTSGSMWYYSRENNAFTNVIIGTTSNFWTAPKLSNGFTYAACNSDLVVQNTTFAPSHAGLLGVSRITTNQLKRYHNGTAYSTEATTAQTLENLKISLFQRNGIGQHTAMECAFAMIAQGLTPTESANLYTAVQAFQTTLGRQV